MQQKVVWAVVQKETGRWSRWKIRDLLADMRCGQAVLDFLTSMDAGRPVPPPEEDDAGSQASEWELRERREREEEQEAEAEDLGAAGGSGATPSFMASAEEEQGTVLCLFLCGFLGAHSIFLGQVWAEGEGVLATCRHRADCGQENRANVRRHGLYRSHASM